MSQECELGYYGKISLLMLEFLSPDMSQYLVCFLKHLTFQEARLYHMKRFFCEMSETTIPRATFSIWSAYNNHHSRMMDDLHMLNDPHFWEYHHWDWEGTLVYVKPISGYSYKNPEYKPWWNPITRHRLQKLDLLSQNYERIKNLWLKYREEHSGNRRRRYRDRYRVTFTIHYLEEEDFSDKVREVWSLC